MSGNVKIRRLVLLVGVAALLGPSCGGTGDDASPYAHPALVPANAWTDELPDPATYVTPETFGALLDAGRIRLVTPADVAEEQQDALDLLQQQKMLAQSLYATRKAVLERHTVAPHDKNPDFDALPDGTWRYHIGNGDPVILQGLLTAYQDLVDATQRFNSVENQRNVYETLYSHLPLYYVQDQQLPDPADVTTYTFDEILDLNATLVSDWPAYAIPLASTKPAGYPASALQEEGNGTWGDTAVYPSPTGLAGQVSFPLKWYVTSIKDQGQRGTCTAFGVTAAVELMIAKQQLRWVNLSEQMLYNRATMTWRARSYGDGYPPGRMLGEMLLKTYRFSFEDSWDYNPSRQRIDHENESRYERSCWASADGSAMYGGEHCSDAVHQATVLVTQVGSIPFTAYVDPTLDVPPDARFMLTGFDAISEPGVLGPGWAMGMLALGIPVIISVTVPEEGFGQEAIDAAGGVVPYSAIEPPGTGGHCMLLVGFVHDTQLPAGVPPSPGMGYFICKNSWGLNHGDQGYFYLSDPWVMRWARGLYTVPYVHEN